jgi:hypothetical protein
MDADSKVSFALNAATGRGIINNCIDEDIPSLDGIHNDLELRKLMGSSFKAS